MDVKTSPYLQAASVLPPPLRAAAEGVPAEIQLLAEEFRLRAGQPLSILARGEERELSGAFVSQEDLRTVLGQGSRYSAHTVFEQLCSGFLTLQGGHRIGLCGDAIMKGSAVHGIRTISSLAIRVARPVPEVGASVLDTLLGEDGALEDTLILAPPGAGKTTLLRDLVRRVSDGIGVGPHRVGLADERREVSALWEGTAQLDVGKRTDIMADCPKAAAAQILVRGMNPQVLAMDEITAEEDLEALLWASGCGVTLLATAHGQDRSSLTRRPLYRKLLDEKVFRKAVMIRQQEGRRTFRVEVLS